MSARPAPAGASDIEARPGRTCPVSYRYSPRVLDREPELVAPALYVVGGLYGNVEALDRVLALAAGERGPVVLAFNGDFHWFDVDAADFSSVQREVSCHAALRGNVETELAHDGTDAGCGCAYPADVSDAEVGRSNAILLRLRDTARADATARAALAALPMHLVAAVGDVRVGIVHGDATSLAGWGFDARRLDAPAHRRWVEDAFAQSGVDVFASSHTCLPALRRFDSAAGERVVANNGAAGMPNFAGTRFGLLTRISERGYEGEARLYGTRVRGIHVDALRIDYDHDRWMKRFLAAWPDGSSAHESYCRRICEGPRHGVEDAAPRAAAAA